MEHQKTIVFIKEEALGISDTIKGYLAQLGNICIEKRIVLTEGMIVAVYPHMSPLIYEATCRHLKDTESIVYLIEGELIIDRVLDFIGYDTDPMLCSAHTIRRWCASLMHKEPQLLSDGSTFYYRNYVHRARTHHEVVQQTKALLGIKLNEH